MKFIVRYKQRWENYHLTVFSVREGNERARLGVLTLLHEEFMALKRALTGKDVTFIADKEG